MTGDLDFAYSLRQHARTNCTRRQETKRLLLEAADVIERQHANLNPDPGVLDEIWAHIDLSTGKKVALNNENSVYLANSKQRGM